MPEEELKTDYKHIYMNELNTNKKTRHFEVTSKSSDGVLGIVKWFAPWRRYAFFPSVNCLFDAACLTSITEFLQELMKERTFDKLINSGQ